MNIVTGSDHAGFALKQDLIAFLEGLGHTVVDKGPEIKSRCDYPDFAAAVAESVVKGEAEWGLLVCGTGIGMAMCANKVDGIRAAVVSDAFSARATRLHNDANVLCLGERVVGGGLATEILAAWLDAEFEGGRHQARIDKMMALEG
jgi:ribose 5-phosphate isomerase B